MAVYYMYGNHNTPEARWGCVCTVLPSGKLLVAGGESVVTITGVVLSTVYTATISGSKF